MNINEIEKKLNTILTTNIADLCNEKLDVNTPLISSGYIDSFDIISILSIIEKEFNIVLNLDNIDIEEFDTIGSLSKLIIKVDKK